MGFIISSFLSFTCLFYYSVIHGFIFSSKILKCHLNTEVEGVTEIDLQSHFSHFAWILFSSMLRDAACRQVLWKVIRLSFFFLCNSKIRRSQEKKEREISDHSINRKESFWNDKMIRIVLPCGRQYSPRQTHACCYWVGGKGLSRWVRMNTWYERRAGRISVDLLSAKRSPAI